MMEEQYLYVQSDQEYDKQIVAQILGQVTSDVAEDQFYKIHQNGKTIKNLTKRGIDNCILKLADSGYCFEEHLPVDFHKDPTDENYMLFQAKVTKYRIEGVDRVFCQAVTGSKRQCIFLTDKYGKIKSRDGEKIVDEHWYEKGSEKALRNAKLKLIPLQLQINLIANCEIAKEKAPHSLHVANQNYNKLPKNNRPALAAPQKSIDDLVQDQSWMSEKYPYPITLIIGEECKQLKHISWSELERYDGVRTKEGRIVGLRQYLHMCKGHDVHGNKYEAAAIIFKQNEQNAQNDTQQQEELFENTPEPAMANHYESEV